MRASVSSGACDARAAGEGGRLSRELVIVEDGERVVPGAGDCLGFGPPRVATPGNESAAPCACVIALARS